MNNSTTNGSPEEPQQISGSKTLNDLVITVYSHAKWWAAVVLWLQSILFLASVAAVFRPNLSVTYPWVALILALLGAWFSFLANSRKSTAENLKRQHEYLVSFGKPPSKTQLADLKLRYSKQLPEQTAALLRLGTTYASVKPVGLPRALENLSESAWYSKHLASYCSRILGTVFVLSIVLSIILLLITASSIPGTPAGFAAAKCIAATLIFLISVGCLRSWIAYIGFSKKAGETDTEAEQLMKEGDPDTFEVHRILAEYQIARNSAPLIPTWIWRLSRKKLEENWKLKRPE